MRKTQKGFAPALLLVLLVVLGVIGYMAYTQFTEIPVSDTASVDQYQTISDSDDLSIITKEFDETELSIDEFESELDTLDSEVTAL